MTLRREGGVGRAQGASLLVTGATCVVIERIATATGVTLTTIGAICGATIAMGDMTSATSVTTVTTNAKTVASTKLHSAAKKRRELLAAFYFVVQSTDSLIQSK